jgi:hypothetical protein
MDIRKMITTNKNFSESVAYMYSYNVYWNAGVLYSNQMNIALKNFKYYGSYAPFFYNVSLP